MGHQRLATGSGRCFQCPVMASGGGVGCSTVGGEPRVSLRGRARRIAELTHKDGETWRWKTRGEREVRADSELGKSGGK